MPNWCTNIVIVSGLNVNSFILENETKEDKLSFAKSVPFPDNIYQGNLGPEEEKLYGKNTWYNWNNENWGTKWDCCDVDCDICLEQVKYTFDTAWTPPQQWLQTTSKKYPDLKFEIEFEEIGCDFWGKILYQKGKILHQEESSLTNHAYDVVGEKTLKKIRQQFLDLFPTFTYQDAEELKELDGTHYQIIEDFLEEESCDPNTPKAYLNAFLSESVSMVISDIFIIMLQAVPKIKRIFRKAVKFRKSTKKIMLKELIEISYMPPDKHGKSALSRLGGVLYRSAEANFKANIS